MFSSGSTRPTFKRTILLGAFLASDLLIGMPSSMANVGAQLNKKIPVEVLVADRSGSGAPRFGDIQQSLDRRAQEIAARDAGLGARAIVASFSGGPGDIVRNEVDAYCVQGPRRCSDRKAVGSRVAMIRAATRAAMARTESDGTSDPWGAVHRVLSDTNSSYPQNQKHFTVITDFYERSPLFNLDQPEFDLTTAAGRRRVRLQLTAAGIDFSKIKMRSFDAIDVQLVPTASTAVSPAAYHAMADLVASLLSQTQATVTVTLLDANPVAVSGNS